MAKLPTNGVPPLLFYLAGVTCWSYFADCVSHTSVTFISNAAIALTPLLLLLEVCDELQLRSPVTGCLGPEPTHEETRVCLPQHPAVAYLFLVVSARCCYLS